MKKLLPEGEEIGLKQEGDPEFYFPDTLYEYINGASEGFINYQFERLIHQIYEGDGSELTVDIYDMGSPLNAFGVYSSERSSDYNYIDVGTEGYLAEYLLNFYKGRYYAKLSAFSEDGELEPLLRRSARVIARRIPDSTGLPPEFSYFPGQGRLPHSEAFILKAPLGHEFLSPAFQVQYRIGEEISSVLVSQAANPEESSERVSRLRDHMERIGDIEPLDEWRSNSFRAKSRYEGAVLVTSLGRLVVIISSPPEKNPDFRDRIVDSLRAWEQPPESPTRSPSVKEVEGWEDSRLGCRAGKRQAGRLSSAAPQLFDCKSLITRSDKVLPRKEPGKVFQ